MKAVIQRAKDARVTTGDKLTGAIEYGYVVLLGVTHDDTPDDVKYLVNKTRHLRVFEDEYRKMNLSLMDVGGGILSISQFTLYADTRKGRRPSFIQAAQQEHANSMYEMFNQLLIEQGIKVETGAFGEMMDVSFTNVGPVTIILDSKDK